MRSMWLVFALALAGPARAQEAPAGIPATSPAGVALGVFAAPALEGGGPWLMPAVRLSAPLGQRHGFDFDVGRIAGGNNPYAEIEHFLAGQIRFLRARAPSQYWLLGLRYVDVWKLDEHVDQRRHQPDAAISLGYGWTATPRRGARLVSEAGFSGGRGYLLYVNVGVQWEPWARH